MTQTTIGILIGKKNYSESSLILSFYTKENGLVSFIFKGVKKKKIPVFLLGIYEITYFKRLESNLGIIQSMQPAVVLNDIFINPQKIIICFFLVDVLRETLKVEQSDPKIFSFLKTQILKLEIEDNLLLYPIQFLALFIGHLGFSPIIESESPNGFDLKTARFTIEKSNLDVQCVRSLSDLFRENEVKMDKILAKETLKILIDYCKIHLPNFNIEKSLTVIRETLFD